MAPRGQRPVVIKRALISVSDKTGIVEFAQGLESLGVELLSTGGTYQLLKDKGVSVTEVSEHTGFPEMMDGRVKTLHPKIHGGILGRRDKDLDVMKEHGIAPIDMVVVNLYPFKATIERPNVTLEEAIENIDIGGPTMVRSAAKNFRDVAIVVDTGAYGTLLAELRENAASLSLEKRFDLSVKAFEHTASYDGMIANYLGLEVLRAESDNTETNPDEHEPATFPRTFNAQFIKRDEMRYGENPHQKAAFYIEADNNSPNIANAEQRQGKALSFNNVADTDAALETVKQFIDPACVIVKHANPCGVAVADTTLKAYQKAFETDKESAFGGIIAFNRPLEEDTAKQIIDQQFVEVIIAPAVSDAALTEIARKKNVRVLVTKDLQAGTNQQYDYKRVGGGLLVQESDSKVITADDLRIVTKRQPSSGEIADLLFTWKVAKMVKSNAIVYGRDLRTVGIGAGQMSRVNSARIATIKAEHAGLTVPGSVMASDAFFPFRDGIDNAAEAGIAAIIQPGGSIRDDEVIAAADEADIAMVFTGVRHFRH